MFSGSEAGEYKDEVMSGERQVGHITCSAIGPSVGKTIAMAYVDTAHSWPGANLVVEINSRPIPARVSQTPFFDPEMARIRAKPQDDDRRQEPAPEPMAYANASVNGSA